jgi:Flp pilus assembly protein TadG
MVAMRKILSNKRGAVAAAFALTLPVMLAGMAMAVDYSMFRLTHTRMQIAADAAALAAIGTLSDSDSTKVSKALAMVSANVPEDFGPVTQASDVTLGRYTGDGTFTPATGSAVNAARVVAIRSPARGNAINRIFSMFISNEDLTISTVAIAARPTNVSYEPPALTLLDNEAGDYNELYVYCYDQDGPGSDFDRRSDMTLIANNVRSPNTPDISANSLPASQDMVLISGGRITRNPPSPSELVWPKCEEKGMTLSFRMRNIRHVKSHPGLWSNRNLRIDGKQPNRPEHNHYTDTRVANGLESFPGLIQPITDNVRCDTLAECNTLVAPNLVFPAGFNRKNRNPRSAPEGCVPGKFMYFGWEDRPPNQTGASGSWLDPAWTDKDFDDIGVVMRCPRSGQLGTGKPRLVG